MIYSIKASRFIEDIEHALMKQKADEIVAAYFAKDQNGARFKELADMREAYLERKKFSGYVFVEEVKLQDHLQTFCGKKITPTFRNIFIIYRKFGKRQKQERGSNFDL